MVYQGGVSYSDKNTSITDLKTWKFVQKLKWAKDQKIIRQSPGELQFSGFLLYALTFVFYGLLFHLGSLDSQEKLLVATVLILHGVEIVLVVTDARVYNGSDVYLQTLIIGIGLFNVFVLAGVLGACLGDDNKVGAGWATASIAAASLANAQMAATLFAFFQGSAPATVAKSAVAAGINARTGAGISGLVY